MSLIQLAAAHWQSLPFGPIYTASNIFITAQSPEALVSTNPVQILVIMSHSMTIFIALAGCPVAR